MSRVAKDRFWPNADIQVGLPILALGLVAAFRLAIAAYEAEPAIDEVGTDVEI